MAQQTINVGAAPNDGTGTPLRTAFQYTNSNFSELYTAVGPSGNNIVVPGSATITGDLTVDTNTLKVDSANNRVGIGTATPDNELSVRAASIATIDVRGGVGGAGGLKISGNGTTLGTTSFDLIQNSLGAIVYQRDALPLFFNVNGSERYAISSTGVATWSNVGGVAGTRMTLNSTGLGVGGSPVNPITAYAAASAKAPALLLTTVGSPTYGWDFSVDGAVNGNLFIRSLVGGTKTDVLEFDRSNGNVGVGVTPSAWGSNYRAVEVSGAVNVFGATTDANFAGIGANLYHNNTNYLYRYSSLATMYLQDNGTHQWYTAPSGTAGNAITFTQAMTLDASGRLLVGKSATNFATVGCELKSNGEIGATHSGSTNSNTCYDLYSTGAAAYRFYVGMAGTVFATNTTISAISDARLKENVQDLDVGLDSILALKPRKFDWKAGKGKDIKGDRGFIAQEFEQVFPNLIDEWRDSAPEGEAPYKSVRQDLIPVLVKAIQELTARVQTLEAR